MQIPNTRECLENLGMQTLHMGQCIALKALGISQVRHWRFGFYKYGLIYNILLPFFLFSVVFILPLVLNATRMKSMTGSKNINEFISLF
jgi:hypothetical protein